MFQAKKNNNPKTLHSVKSQNSSLDEQIQVRGKSGVKNLKGTLSLTNSGSRPLMLSTLMSGKYFSPTLGGIRE